MTRSFSIFERFIVFVLTRDQFQTFVFFQFVYCRCTLTVSDVRIEFILLLVCNIVLPAHFYFLDQCLVCSQTYLP